jgi:hypothetical protein
MVLSPFQRSRYPQGGLRSPNHFYDVTRERYAIVISGLVTTCVPSERRQRNEGDWSSIEHGRTRPPICGTCHSTTAWRIDALDVVECRTPFKGANVICVHERHLLESRPKIKGPNVLFMNDVLSTLFNGNLEQPLCIRYGCAFAAIETSFKTMRVAVQKKSLRVPNHRPHSVEVADCARSRILPGGGDS